MPKREWPEGRISGDDDGAVQLAIAADPANGIVRIQFPHPVLWCGLPPVMARALAAKLLEKAEEVENHAK